MILKLPALIAQVRRHTAQSSAIIVKLPGIIGLLATFFAVLFRKPIVTQVVGDIEDVMRSGVAGRPGRLMAPIAASLTRLAVGRADAVRYVTQETLQRKYPANERATTAVYSDVAIAVDPSSQRHEPRGQRLISVGSQENSYKGHEYLIEAVALLRPSYPGLSLSLVGDGRHQDVLIELCQRLGMEESVHFAGHIGSRSALTHLIDESLIFVLPSITEGLPRSLIEAMARGLPCIGTNVGGTPELLPTHMLVPPGDAAALAGRIEQLLTEPELRSAEGLRNIRKASEFSGASHAHKLQHWQAIVQTTLSVE